MSSARNFIWNTAMNTTISRLLLSSLVTFAAAGCDFDDPCGRGLVEGDDHMCREPPAPPSEAGATDGGAEAAATSSFGKTCTDMPECGGDAPICAAPELPYCTQIECQAGEANAGVCPEGWQCIKAGEQPSACVKM